MAITSGMFEAPDMEPGDRVGFAVYDPTTRQCTFASAGQPAPVLVRPDQSTEQLDVPPGPPLGVGGLPYENTTITLEPGSTLALFTDGLLELEPY